MQLGLMETPSPSFARVMVVDLDDGRVWTGRGWSGDIRDAALFLTADHARPEYERVVALHYGEAPAQVFLGTLTVEVRGKAVGRDDLIEYLVRAIAVLQDTSTHGTGPTGDSHVRVVIPWGDLGEG